MSGWTFHPTAVVIGLLFLVLGVAFLLDQLQAIELQARYIAPAWVIGLGLAIMAGSLRQRSRES